MSTTTTTNGLIEGAPIPIPPTVAQPYDRDKALDDIPAAGYALNTFYASQMVEAEAYIDENDPEKYAYIQVSGIIQANCWQS